VKHVISTFAVAVFATLVLAPVPAFAASAKGTVAAVAADTITVKVAGKDTTFSVDAKTDVVAKGAGTATKEAKKEGMKGAKFGDIVKVGDEVDVSYKDVSGKNVASMVRVTKKAAAAK
jgi:hypothetical protein